MNKTIDNDTVKKLTGLYQEDEVARRLFDWLSERRKDITETSVDRASWMAQSQPYEIIRLFRELEEIGCGTFILGRKGWKTRFRWNYSVRSLGETAKGQTAKLADIDINNVDVEENMQDTGETVSILMHAHNFQLRPNLQLTIELPGDFSAKEAERMSQWLKSIPF